jgi:hypothetical protein
VDEELRRELLARRDEDQRIRTLVSPPRGQHTVRLPQLYGTQFTVTGGEFGPHPIEDPQRLDERRAAAGLEPFADYEARMRTQS